MNYLRYSVISMLFGFFMTGVPANGCDSECLKNRAALERDAGISKINEVWLKTRELKNQCDSFPYFPNGGIQSAYCFFKTKIPQSTLEKISGHKVFLFSPHKNDEINNRSATDFGHYNPAFLRWAIDNVLPVVSNEYLESVAQKNYQWSMASTARHYYVAYFLLQRDNAQNHKIQTDYRSAMKNGVFYNSEDLFYYLKPEHAGALGFSVDGNVMKNAVPFWIRRELDGTDHLFIEGLEKVFNAYEPEFLRKVESFMQSDSASATVSHDGNIQY